MREEHGRRARNMSRRITNKEVLGIGSDGNNAKDSKQHTTDDASDKEDPKTNEKQQS